MRLQTWREPGLSLKVDLINDVPAHVGEITLDTTRGRLDSAENILANKVTAALDRSEPKDLADIWGFCCLRGLSLPGALTNAESKAVVVFPADMARLLLGASATDHELVRWITAPGEFGPSGRNERGSVLRALAWDRRRRVRGRRRSYQVARKPNRAA